MRKSIILILLLLSILLYACNDPVSSETPPLQYFGVNLSKTEALTLFDNEIIVPESVENIIVYYDWENENNHNKDNVEYCSYNYIGEEYHIMGRFSKYTSHCAAAWAFELYGSDIITSCIPNLPEDQYDQEIIIMGSIEVLYSFIDYEGTNENQIEFVFVNEGTYYEITFNNVSDAYDRENYLESEEASLIQEAYNDYIERISVL